MGDCLSALCSGHYKVIEKETPEVIDTELFDQMDEHHDDRPSTATRHCIKKRASSYDRESTHDSRCKRACVRGNRDNCQFVNKTELNLSRTNNCSNSNTNSSTAWNAKCENSILRNQEQVEENAEYTRNSDSIHSKHINDLPQSLLLQVFHRLPLYDLLRRASLVSKYWHRLCCEPELWRHIRLQGMMKVDDEVLHRLTSYSDNVTEIDITDTRQVTTCGVTSVLQKCTNLQVFRAARCQSITDSALCELGDNCHHIKQLYIDCCFAMTDAALVKIGKGCPWLTRLRLNQCFKITDDGMGEITRGCPQLKHLLLDQCTKIGDETVKGLAENCPQLEEASFLGCDLTEDGILCLAKCSKLKVLELSNISRTTCKSVMHIIRHCKDMTSLNLCLCSNIDDNCVEYIAKYAQNLRKIHLVSCNISDIALEVLGKYSKCIQHVDVGWCERITDAGVLMIAETLKSLRYLGLIRCDQVSIPTMEDMVIRFPQIEFSTVYLDCKRLVEKAKAAGFVPEDVQDG